MSITVRPSTEVPWDDAYLPSADLLRGALSTCLVGAVGAT